MDKNETLGKLLMGRTDLFKVSNEDGGHSIRVALAQAGAIAVATVGDSREGARLKDRRAAPSDIAATTAAQAVSLSAGQLGPGDRFKGRISGSRWNWGRSDAGAKMRSLSEVQGFLFVQGEGLPEKGLYCPANDYRDKLLQLVLGEDSTRPVLGHEGVEKVRACFAQFIGTEVTGEIVAVLRGIEGRELRLDGALSWLPAEARQRMERDSTLQSLFSSSRLAHAPTGEEKAEESEGAEAGSAEPEVPGVGGPQANVPVPKRGENDRDVVAALLGLVRQSPDGRVVASRLCSELYKECPGAKSIITRYGGLKHFTASPMLAHVVQYEADERAGQGSVVLKWPISDMVLRQHRGAGGGPYQISAT